MPCGRDAEYLIQLFQSPSLGLGYNEEDDNERQHIEACVGAKCAGRCYLGQE